MLRSCFLSSYVNSIQQSQRKSQNMSQPIRGLGSHILFWISPKNTNLVEDVENLLPVKFRWIPFGGFIGEVENVSANPGLSICLIWGRYSAPFPMQNSIFFSQFRPKVFPIWLLYEKKNGKVENKMINSIIIIREIEVAKGPMQDTWCTIKGNKYMDNKICLGLFPILRKTPLFFPIPRAPGPSPKKGCKSPAIRGQGGYLVFLISPKNANLVEDVEILLPVKFCWILFSGFRRKVENASANHRPGRRICFSDPPEKHKLGRGRWDLASYQVSMNSFQRCQRRSRKCLSPSEARAAILFFRSARKTQTW